MGTFRLDFVGVGPQRTGTTWLYRLLQLHPALCFPKGVEEPMFFDLHYEKGLSRYAAYFTHRKRDQLCGEKSPTYFDVEVVPDRIRQVNPECKIIINLRDPVSRSFSLYRHHLSKGRVNGTFSDAVLQMPRIVSSGKYAQHIPKWIDTFGADQVTFILLDDIIVNPESVLKQIYNFLGVPEIPMLDIGKEKINAFTMSRFHWLARVTTALVTELRSRNLSAIIKIAKMLRLKKFVYTGGKYDIPELSERERYQLLEEYEIDITFVENLLKRDLSAWRKIG